MPYVKKAQWTVETVVGMPHPERVAENFPFLMTALRNVQCYQVF